jgi:Gnt-I system low-affinity gluconate transporter
VIVAALGVVLLLFLIIQRKLHAFVALLLVSVLIGLGAQLPHVNPEKVLKAMQDGMGGTLGFVAVVVGLGAMFGRLLEVSGGAEVLAQGLLGRFGEKRAPTALGVAGFLVSIPVFFDVAFVILAPILYGLAEKSGKPLMRFAIPLLAGMVVSHSFVPPTPGPIGVAAILGADLGYVILFGIVVGVPCMALAGPVFARFVADRVPGKVPELGTPSELRPAGSPPSFGLIAGLIGLPIGLILANTATAAVLTEARVSASPSAGTLATLRDVAALFGHPFVALLITTLLCFHLLGTRRGLSRQEVSDVATRALEPAGIIILVTGAGGVLKQVMIETNVGKVIADQLSGLGVAPVLLAFALALVVRVMQGSATVAMLTAAGLVVPLIEPTEPSSAMRALLVVPIAAGATCLSHVNDSGFWLVSRYLGLSVQDTLRTWSALTTVVAVTGLACALVLSLFIR